MKALLISTLLAVSIILFSCKDDSNSPENNDNPVETIDTISIDLTEFDENILGTTNSTPEHLSTYCLIQNNSNRDIEIEVDIVVFKITDGHELTVNHGNYTESGINEVDTYTLSSTINIQEGESSTISDLHAKLETNGNAGETLIQFKFFPLDSTGERLIDIEKKFFCTFSITPLDDTNGFAILDQISTVTGNQGASELTTSCTILNTSDKAMEFILSAKLVDHTEGHFFNYYYGGKTFLHTPFGAEFSSPVTLAPGEKSSLEDFKCNLTANAKGMSKVKFIFIPLHEDGYRLDEQGKSYTCTWDIN